MLDFIKALLHGKSAEGPPPNPSVELMSFPDMADYIRQLPELMTPKEGFALTKRLYEIALYDHHVEKEHRMGALRLLDTVKTTLESVMAPELIEAYRKANAYMEDNVHRHGINSLAWLIEEQQIPKDHLIPFIARPEHGKLLDNFFDVLDPAIAEKLKLELEQYLRGPNIGS